MRAEPQRRQLADPDAIAEALDRQEPVRLLLVRSGPLSARALAVLARCQAGGVRVSKTSPRDVERMAVGSSAEILALIGPDPEAPLSELVAAGGALWLLAGVGYPGNCGFAIRAAEVSGAAGIVVDAPFDRAGRRQACPTAMRADRFFPVHWQGASEAVAMARSAGRRVICIEDTGDRAPWQTDLTGPVLLVIGGEAGGIPEEVLAHGDAILRIPMAGFVPSYNLQAALAMVAGERLRQLEAPAERPQHR